MGVEILEEWPDVDTIVVPIGGGGLISGIGLWVKTISPTLRLVGVQPEASPPRTRDAKRDWSSAAPAPLVNRFASTGGRTWSTQ